LQTESATNGPSWSVWRTSTDERRVATWRSDCDHRFVRRVSFISKRCLRQLRLRRPFWPRTPSVRTSVPVLLAMPALPQRGIAAGAWMVVFFNQSICNLVHYYAKGDQIYPVLHLSPIRRLPILSTGHPVGSGHGAVSVGDEETSPTLCAGLRSVGRHFYNIDQACFWTSYRRLIFLIIPVSREASESQ